MAKMVQVFYNDPDFAGHLFGSHRILKDPAFLFCNQKGKGMRDNRN